MIFMVYITSVVNGVEETNAIGEKNCVPHNKCDDFYMTLTI